MAISRQRLVDFFQDIGNVTVPTMNYNSDVKRMNIQIDSELTEQQIFTKISDWNSGKGIEHHGLKLYCLAIFHGFDELAGSLEQAVRKLPGYEKIPESKEAIWKEVEVVNYQNMVTRKCLGLLKEIREKRSTNQKVSAEQKE